MADGMYRGLGGSSPVRFSDMAAVPNFVDRHARQRPQSERPAHALEAQLTLKDIAGALPASPRAARASDIAGQLHRRTAQVKRGLLRLVELYLASRAESDGSFSLHIGAQIPDEVVLLNPSKDKPDSAPGTIEGNAARGHYAKPVEPDDTLQRLLLGTPDQQKADDAAIAASRARHFHAAFDAAKKNREADAAVAMARHLAREIVALREAADMAETRLKTALAAPPPTELQNTGTPSVGSFA